MLLKPNTVVVVLKGKFAGKKGVIIKQSEDGSRFMVAGVQKMPRPITEDMSDRMKRRNAKIRVFIKNYNPAHLLVTRYRSDAGLGMFDLSKSLDSLENKKESIEIVKKSFLEASNKKSKWLFSKLAF